ncbi:RNA-binding motif protein, X-linked 2-like [Sitodiplosis mosellana]|uniref:RNA-binding motif protein, X-linked 2-like n=1 Tax=Sitodiplosis mosellana TaxID=263140 RepID=UPI002444E43D|nr:RNA-binding motif protein, X-linked 2-like [Sitodiplosis mosellana]
MARLISTKHRNQKRFKCEVCDHEFTTKTNLNNHVKKCNEAKKEKSKVSRTKKPDTPLPTLENISRPTKQNTPRTTKEKTPQPTMEDTRRPTKQNTPQKPNENTTPQKNMDSPKENTPKVVEDSPYSEPGKKVFDEIKDGSSNHGKSASRKHEHERRSKRHRKYYYRDQKAYSSHRKKSGKCDRRCCDRRCCNRRHRRGRSYSSSSSNPSSSSESSRSRSRSPNRSQSRSEFQKEIRASSSTNHPNVHNQTPPTTNPLLTVAIDSNAATPLDADEMAVLMQYVQKMHKFIDEMAPTTKKVEEILGKWKQTQK